MNTSSRLLSVIGFVVLSAFCGVGLAWIIVGLFASSMVKGRADSFVAQSMPVLAVGGVLGFVIGLLVAMRVARADPETEAKLRKKYIRRSDRVRIYFGAPMFVIAISVPLLEPLTRLVGTSAGAYIWLGIALAIIALSLFIHDRLPDRSIIPIGIIGWLLTILLAIGMGLYMLGIFRHGSAA